MAQVPPPRWQTVILSQKSTVITHSTSFKKTAETMKPVWDAELDARARAR